jgi:hypothetical protein
VHGRHGKAAIAAALLGMALAANDWPMVAVIAHAVVAAIAICLALTTLLRLRSAAGKD